MLIIYIIRKIILYTKSLKQSGNINSLKQSGNINIRVKPYI